MEITRNGVDTNPGPSEWFTGAVYLDTVATPSESFPVTASSVPLHARSTNGVAHASERADDYS